MASGLTTEERSSIRTLLNGATTNVSSSSNNISRNVGLQMYFLFPNFPFKIMDMFLKKI